MRPPINITEIPPTKIAVEASMSLDDFRLIENQRWLKTIKDFSLQTNEPISVYFADKTTRFYEKMQLIDALELLITPKNLENVKKVDFTWDIIKYTKD